MKQDLMLLVLAFFFSVALTACVSAPATPAGSVTAPAATSPADTPPPTAVAPSSTPDPCSTEQLEAEVQKVHRYMREFDDASLLASNLPREQLNDAIANLQRIRRESEDEQIPACLNNLKKYQVDHMNTVINTLVVFMGGAEQSALEQGISIARAQHDQYTLELARLLGLTVVPLTESAGATPTETAAP